MFTKRNPVNVLVLGLLVTMKIKRRFPVKAIGIVMEYNAADTALCAFVYATGVS